MAASLYTPSLTRQPSYIGYQRLVVDQTGRRTLERARVGVIKAHNSCVVESFLTEVEKEHTLGMAVEQLREVLR